MLGGRIARFGLGFETLGLSTVLITLGSCARIEVSHSKAPAPTNASPAAVDQRSKRAVDQNPGSAGSLGRNDQTDALEHRGTKGAGQSKDEPRVQFSLALSHSPAGKKHLVAIFQIPPHWHIYWMNPGESGLSTIVRVDRRESLKHGELRYPAPQRRVETGDIETFVYEKEVALLGELKAESLHGLIRADAEWLVCKEICVPERASAEIDLENATETKWSRFASSADRVPDSLSVVATQLELSKDQKTLSFRVQIPNASGRPIDFYPYNTDPYSLANRTFTIHKDQVRFQYNGDFSASHPLGELLRDIPSLQRLGVVQTRDDAGHNRFFELNLSFE